MISLFKRWFGRERVDAVAPVSALAAGDGLASCRAGIARYITGDYVGAEVCLRQALDEQHDLAEAHCYLGRIHHKRGEFDDAADCFNLAVHFQPDYAEPYYFLALLAQQKGDDQSAVDHATLACARRPNYGDAHNLLGALALSLSDTEGAVASFKMAVECDPDRPRFLSNLGYVLMRDCGQHVSGTAYLEKALALSPADPAILVNYCFVLSNEGRLDEMIQICDRLLSVKPDCHEARLNRALALLKKARFAEAWPDYEARRHTRSNFISRPYRFPQWQGQPLAGRTILVYGEQGLGDEIMFASCFGEVIAQAGRCIIECSPRLEALFRRSFPSAVVRGELQTAKDEQWIEALGPVDFQMAAGSLPGLLRRQWSDFPSYGSYLRPESGRVDYWSARLRALGDGPKIGINWRGGSLSTRGGLRSLQLDMLKPLLQRPGVHFVSLQYDASVEELSDFADTLGVVLPHWSEAIDNLDETAALMQGLDLVITVCSASLHLAGALGRPVWGMVPAVPEWRYLEAGECMPWYPSVRMFRQHNSGQWQDVIDQISQALSQRYSV